MSEIHNPILPGFHPDPSIVRVGEDYYLATSTFEWYPGVCIYHSRDLANWQLVAQPLSRLTQLDMRGNPDSCGVWAPCLSHHNGVFFLAYTNVRRFAGAYKDTPNYYVSSPSIEGPWSEPVFVNSSGFDPSLFHHTDGRTYWLNMVWNHQPAAGRNNWLPASYFGGVVMQELDLDSGKLVGEARTIFSGSSRGLTEGPHLYQRDGFYYLLTAEGGTGKDHACTFARSTSLWGPYEVDPAGSLLSSRDAPSTPLKRAGHGDWVETPQGDCYLVHLCSRPLSYRGRSVMGRETALQKLHWPAGQWPRLPDGAAPALRVSSGAATGVPRQAICETLTFNQQALPGSWQSLRYPLPDYIVNQHERPGYLRLRGQESLGSLFEQSLLARRQQAFCFRAEARLDFAPLSFQQMAGLVLYYNSRKYYYLHISHDKQAGRVIDLSMCLNEVQHRYPLGQPLTIPATGEVTLHARVDHDLLYVGYALDDQGVQWLDLCLDYSVLCDEVGDGGADANFTGCFVGICSQDLTGQRLAADFRHVIYEELQTTS